jgi:hypothetical protein
MVIALVEVDEQSKDKNESEKSGSGLSAEAEKVIAELDAMHGQGKKKVFELIDILKRDGLKDHQIGKVLVDRVKFISRSTLYEYIPPELKREYTKPLPKTINVSTEHKVIDVEPVGEKELEHMDKIPQQEEEEIKKIGEIRRAEEKREAEEEEPTELELLKIENEQLKDALHKTQQFKPATALEGKRLSLDETAVFEFLAKRDNGVNCFWYPNYGIDLFPSRVIAYLKRRGVKTFKRLYFEV